MFFTVGLIGTVFILKYGTILDPLRCIIVSNIPTLDELFKCSLCLGFWVGMFWMFVYPEWCHFITPFFSAAVCWVSDTVMQFVQGCDVLVDKKCKKD